MIRLNLIVFAVAFCALGPALAQDTQPTLLGTFEAFKAYRVEKNGALSCYVVAQPDKMAPANVRRDPVHLLIMHRPKDKVRNELSLQMGYPVKTSVPVALEIPGNGSFSLAGYGQ